MIKQKEIKKEEPTLFEPWTWTEEELKEMEEDLFHFDMKESGFDEKKARKWARLTTEVKRNPLLEPCQIVELFYRKYPEYKKHPE